MRVERTLVLRPLTNALTPPALLQRVHEQLLGAVLALPMAFFDATPPGRILNRFSSDTGKACWFLLRSCDRQRPPVSLLAVPPQRKITPRATCPCPSPHWHHPQP